MPVLTRLPRESGNNAARQTQDTNHFGISTADSRALPAAAGCAGHPDVDAYRMSRAVTSGILIAPASCCFLRRRWRSTVAFPRLN